MSNVLQERWRSVYADILRTILLCLAVAVLAVGFKNYLVYLLYDTALCSYLCPSIFGERQLDPPMVLEQLFAFQVWIEETLQGAFDELWPDPYRLSTVLIVAPLVEEGLYRGPLFLARSRSRSWPWWTAASLLSAVFALGHGRTGLSLLPLFVLGMASAWLIMKTQRFWPSLSLHFLFNFFFSSTVLCPFLFTGD